MKVITEHEYNKVFCNNYKETYYSIPPKTTPASTFDETLRAVCRYSQGRGKILEIGTWIGRSALGFSQNFNSVMTLDFIKGSDIAYDYLGMCSGHLVKNKQNVTCILEDSRRFDFSEYEDYFDCVYVDGNHTTDCCFFDLVTASKVCKVGGIIFVDDYCDTMLGVKVAFDKFESYSKHIIKDLNLAFFINYKNYCVKFL